MSLHSTARFNSAVTNASFHLRAAASIRPIPEQEKAYQQAVLKGRYAAMPNYEVIGVCGHRIMVIGYHDARTLVEWNQSIHDPSKRAKSKRCDQCPKEI